MKKQRKCGSCGKHKPRTEGMKKYGGHEVDGLGYVWGVFEPFLG